MTIGDHTPTPAPDERREVSFGYARQVVIAAIAALLGVVGLIAFAIE
jgi:hypothetical protein